MPRKKLAFEYQGEQHFKSITFGGNEDEANNKFKEQQDRDRLKRDLCKKRGIKLIEVRYDEPLDEKYLVGKIGIELPEPSGEVCDIKEELDWYNKRLEELKNSR